ncbi:putative mitochondrial inner membrane protease subunit 1 [Aspergillus uvarum CBS 121591]|uniref:Putative mitochondrial inner membrane protease subunit 1 n=3 Tax=Aspergillus TaxID=5052 RepID=A0A319DTU6_9EURO|nr:putative mitochondrial inner membrane protease subunit 1 [Aspergillus uvarum CBS 121591]XP_025528206.1 putative mitochondrial inner membrane protease subunit 1 [Aspergillus japonicus CBS 114.51]PYH82582.1 putative mitochondrial inner membrane protease subunit 1 [Aspergillus uvarum CBS 121591]PYI14043.1 putative mitochondrial inner membrane protease subunit 1 [Aspergillus violaceofuscus CBS 115571]RAH82312.1 putative mitochondrial inner membrane protease subunit 1 [Aspergillus japonicus CBS 1
MDRLLRATLQRSTPAHVFRLTLNGLGLFCACTLVWEHLVTVQLSEGPSMYPTFQPRGDYLLISRVHRHGRGVAVGDVVRFYHPSFLGVNGAKRVIGLPGDLVCRDLPFSMEAGGTGEMIRVPEGHVYLAGDNLPWSRDSRNYGPIPMGLINGKIVARVWPPSRMMWVENTLKPAQLD